KGDPILMRWRVDGDLRTARYASRDPSGVPDPLSSGLGGTSSDPKDPLVDTIERTDDTHATVPRSTVDAVLADPIKFGKGAGVVPAVKKGMPAGFKLYAIRPGSFWSKLGFQNGDTLERINGNELTDANKALDVYTKLRGNSHFSCEILRRGQPVTLEITIK